MKSNKIQFRKTQELCNRNTKSMGKGASEPLFPEKDAVNLMVSFFSAQQPLVCNFNAEPLTISSRA